MDRASADTGTESSSLPARLARRGAPGLRGQIVGAVLITTVVTLSVAALVLLPQLEHSLRTAARNSLEHDIRVSQPEIHRLSRIDYWILPLAFEPQLKGTRVYADAQIVLRRFQRTLGGLRQRLGSDEVFVIGYVDTSGHGHPIGLDTNGPDAAELIDESRLNSAVAAVRRTGRAFVPRLSFGQNRQQYVRAVIPLPDDAVLTVRKSIGSEVSFAARAVARAFELAALAGLLLTGLLAIPLAATLVRRLQRLRQAAQRVAVQGAGAEVPIDRARDEVGDLARAFAIMQRRLVHQETARRAFVATASHELRTPLASLEGMLELLADDLADPNRDLEEAGALLERARAQSHRLSRLAADLLDLSRIDAEVPLRSEPVELGEVARAVVAEFELTSTHRSVQIAVRAPLDAVWVLGDPGKIAQILRILLDNALRVAPPASEVTVVLDRGGLTVTDVGPGVAPQERELIFERFKRGAATGGEAGFGLGLAIGRELARRMDGDLGLDDTDTGASFRLTLVPTASDTPTEASASLEAARR